MKNMLKILILIKHFNAIICQTSFILSEDLAKTHQSETSIMKLAYAENNIIADKKRRNFF